MASRKFATVPPYTGRNDSAVIGAMASVIGYITAQQQEVVQPLATTASTADTIAKVNEIIARLQGTQ